MLMVMKDAWKRAYVHCLYERFNERSRTKLGRCRNPKGQYNTTMNYEGYFNPPWSWCGESGCSGLGMPVGSHFYDEQPCLGHAAHIGTCGVPAKVAREAMRRMMEAL